MNSEQGANNDDRMSDEGKMKVMDGWAVCALCFVTTIVNPSLIEALARTHF